MIYDNSQFEADALYAHLRKETAPGSALPEEAGLGDLLQGFAEELSAGPGFKAGLEARLRRQHSLLASRPNPRPQSLRLLLASARPFAWAGMAVVLIFALGWVIRNALPPQAASPATASPAPATLAAPAALTPAATGNVTETAEQASPTPVLPTPDLQSYQSPMLPGVQISFNAPMPEAPAEMAVYTQTVPAGPLDAETARQIAAQIGLSGDVYRTQDGPPGEGRYIVSDGWDRVAFYKDTPDQFYYSAGFAGLLSGEGEPLPFDQQAAIAKEFLQSHGLLDFPYRTEPGWASDDVVRFLFELDGLPVRYSLFESPAIDVQISPDGRVMSVSYTRLAFQSLGKFPIISAQVAWDQVVRGETLSGSDTSSRSKSPHDLQTWRRQLPAGQRIDLYGYPEILPADEAGRDPLVTLYNLPLSGDLQSFAQQILGNQFVHVWGQLAVGENGRQRLQMEGWEPSPLPDQSLQGAIQRQGEAGSLLTKDGHTFGLPGLPDSVPDGSKALVRGVLVEQGGSVLDWSTIQVGDLGGGGGGGGGGSGFAELNLNPQAPVPGDAPDTSQPTATPLPLPTEAPASAPPARLDGETGSITAFVYTSPDGSSRTEVFILIPPSPERPDVLYARLVGSGLEELARLHRLPVKVWGEVVQNPDGSMSIAVERWEEAYPGLAVQAWLGASEKTTLDGQDAILFTAQSGEQYVLFNPLGFPETNLPGQPGDEFIIEGVAYPNKNFAGYPVLYYHTASPSGGRKDLVGYTIPSALPITLEDPGQQAAPAQATVESVELVYHAPDNRGLPPDAISMAPYVQPVWRFTGHYDNGSELEILVQALDDAYLK